MGILDGDVEHFFGEENQVVVRQLANEPGGHVVKGHVIDSNIEPIQGTMFGTEKGTITYFEHSYYVVPQSKI